MPGGTAGRPGSGFANRPAPLPGMGGGGGAGIGGNRPTTLPGNLGAGGGLPGGMTRPSPGGRPSLGATTKPFPAPGIGGGGNRPGLGGGNRPTTLPGQIGGGNRPTTLPGQIGGGGPGGNRPGGNRPDGGLAGGNRPTTLPGQIGPNRPGIGGNRPGIGGNRPGIGGNRPGDISGGVNRPGIGGNRPTTLPGDLAGNRPGGQWNRPGIGGNRPGIGDGNNLWNSGNNSGNWNSGNNNFNNINVNGGWGGGYYGNWGGGYNNWGGGYNNWGGGYNNWGYPGHGGGYGGWANNWNNGYVNPHYGNWYNSCWNGNWGGYNGGWWAPFAAGAATWGVLSLASNWGLGYGTVGYGAGGYVNPYYASVPATVVASSPYDYSQPVVVSNYVTTDGDLSSSNDSQGATGGTSTATASPTVTTDVNAAVDDALATFKAGDYSGALGGFDKALKLSPNDSVIHEVRALALFALGRYPEAAATLNSVLASAPGMDWTTISNVYGSVDAYTAHLRKLEDFCRANPGDAAAHFVLAYHYLVGGHSDSAAAALKVVVAKQPTDAVAKRLLDALTPPAEEAKPAATAEAAKPAEAPDAKAAAPAGPETDLVGVWKATSGKETVMLTITEDSNFTWKASPEGKPAVELAGTIETAGDAIALTSEKAGTMVGKVASKGPDAFEFSLPGAPKDAKPLLFQRQ